MKKSKETAKKVVNNTKELASYEQMYKLLLKASKHDMSFEVRVVEGTLCWSKTFYVSGYESMLDFPVEGCTTEQLEMVESELDWKIQEEQEERKKEERKRELLSKMSNEDKKLLGLI